MIATLATGIYKLRFRKEKSIFFFIFYQIVCKYHSKNTPSKRAYSRSEFRGIPLAATVFINSQSELAVKKRSTNQDSMQVVRSASMGYLTRTLNLMYIRKEQTNFLRWFFFLSSLQWKFRSQHYKLNIRLCIIRKLLEALWLSLRKLHFF